MPARPVPRLPRFFLKFECVGLFTCRDCFFFFLSIIFSGSGKRTWQRPWPLYGKAGRRLQLRHSVIHDALCRCAARPALVAPPPSPAPLLHSSFTSTSFFQFVGLPHPAPPYQHTRDDWYFSQLQGRRYAQYWARVSGWGPAAATLVADATLCSLLENALDPNPSTRHA